MYVANFMNVKYFKIQNKNIHTYIHYSAYVLQPDESSCPCLNGGTCRYLSRRGRTIVYCLCQTGYIGNHCQTSKQKLKNDLHKSNIKLLGKIFA